MLCYLTCYLMFYNMSCYVMLYNMLFYVTFYTMLCYVMFVIKHVMFMFFATVYLTIIPRGRVGYEMIDSQRGA